MRNGWGRIPPGCSGTSAWRRATWSPIPPRATRPGRGFTPGLLHGTWDAADARDKRRYADWLAETYGFQSTWLDREAFGAICRSPVYEGGMLDEHGGHVHPLRLCLGLAAAAEAAGAVIF